MSNGIAQHEIVVRAIQEMIAAGEFGPGDKLPVEADLADRIGVSRGSLREGVRALVAMGILETKQGSGTTVTPLDPKAILQPLLFWASLQAGPSAENLHAVRRALEVEAAGLTAQHVSASLLDTLDEILHKAGELIVDHDHEGAMQQDIAFHLAISRASGNLILAALIETLSHPTIRSRMWQSLHRSGRLETAHKEHLAIRDQISLRNPLAARAAMELHLFQSAAHVEDS